MDWLQSVLDHTQYSFVTAFVLGLMTAISPCPLATNVSAIGFIGRDVENRKKVFLNGVVYTLGRAFSYIALGILIVLGISKFSVSMLFQQWGEKLLGPILILIGLIMLNVIQLRFPTFLRVIERFEKSNTQSTLNAFLLGVIFALAFCPYSGVIYFATLMPMVLESTGGLYLTIPFAVATGLPVILFAWLLAFMVGNVGKLYNRIKIFELWFRRIVAMLFILVGIYYLCL